MVFLYLVRASATVLLYRWNICMSRARVRLDISLRVFAFIWVGLDIFPLGNTASLVLSLTATGFARIAHLARLILTWKLKGVRRVAFRFSDDEHRITPVAVVF
jgi:hypothetical protein